MPCVTEITAFPVPGLNSALELFVPLWLTKDQPMPEVTVQVAVFVNPATLSVMFAPFLQTVVGPVIVPGCAGGAITTIPVVPFA